MVAPIGRVQRAANAVLGTARSARGSSVARRATRRVPRDADVVDSLLNAPQHLGAAWLPAPTGFPSAGQVALTIATRLGVPGAMFFDANGDAGVQRRVLAAARQCSVIDDEPSLHEHADQRARYLFLAAASGCPLRVVDLGPSERALLGEHVGSALLDSSGIDFANPLRREAHSVRLRRSALLTSLVHSSAPLPSVSVVMASRRPRHWSAAFTMLARQTLVRPQLVLASHDAGSPSDEVLAPLTAAGIDVRLVHCASSLSLGEVLNAGVAAADGEVIVKWDDDDLYGPDHLVDLLVARASSGADLVGKGAEFTRLSSGKWIRRFAGGGESFARSVAGGTLTIGASTLRDIGGFRPLPVGEDTDLAAQVRSQGGTVYRTHGFGYALIRSPDATWRTSDLRLWFQADQWLAAPDLRWCQLGESPLSGAPC
jgi:glycosyltransferase involved in cell wall biosynthesis